MCRIGIELSGFDAMVLAADYAPQPCEVAEHERSVMLEREREGVAKAKALGKYKGRARTAMAKAGEVEKLLADGVRLTDVARKLGIGRSSVYRAIRERNIQRSAA